MIVSSSLTVVIWFVVFGEIHKIKLNESNSDKVSERRAEIWSAFSVAFLRMERLRL